jgi:hypothetical protein
LRLQRLDQGVICQRGWLFLVFAAATVLSDYFGNICVADVALLGGDDDFGGGVVDAF